MNINTSNGQIMVQVTSEPLHCTFDRKNGAVNVTLNGVVHTISKNIPSAKKAEEIMSKILNDYIKLQSNMFGTDKRADHYSTWKVFGICILIILTAALYGWWDQRNTYPDSLSDNKGIDSGYVVSEQFVNDILNTDIDVEAVKKRKIEIHKIKNKLAKMDPSERKAYLLSPQVQKMLEINP